MNMKNTMSKIAIFFITILVSIFLFTCKKDKDRIPYVYVDFYLNLNDPDFNELSVVGNAIAVTGGVKGVIIYRKSFDEFVALDRCCSYEPSKSCEYVSVDSTGLFAECNCCKSQFFLYDGYVNKGPAEYPLAEYRTSFNSYSNTLHVFN
jgi:nitrite reductase/ring-hydroxylating ferredoxin subunit